MNMLKTMRFFLLDLLFPLQCLECGAPDTPWCDSCLSRQRSIPPQCFVCKLIRPGTGRIPPGRTCESCRKDTDIYAFISPFFYQEPTMKRAIYAFKYRRMKALSGVFAHALINHITRYECRLPRDAVVIPIPLSARRKRARGFNQSELIARELCRSFGFTLDTASLARTRHTPTQTSLAVQARHKNVEHAFTVLRPEMIKNKTIVLIDDVKTTGATLNEATKTLKAAGAGNIWAVTIAH